MKKVAVLLLTLTFLISITGCVGVHRYESAYKERNASLIEEIVLYSLHEFENGLALKYSVPESDTSIDDLDTLSSPVSSLESESFLGFIEELDKISLRSTYIEIMNIDKPPQKAYRGYVIKILYTNGDCDIISREAQIYYTQECINEHENTYNNSEWNDLISKYFPDCAKDFQAMESNL